MDIDSKLEWTKQTMEDPCICSLSLEDQSLKGFSSFNISVDEITDDLRDHLNLVRNNNNEEKSCQTQMKTYSDPLLVKNSAETLRRFMSKRFTQNPFYFIFSENKSDCDNDRVNELDIKNLTPCKEKVKEKFNSTSSEVSVFGSPLKLESIGDVSLNETSFDISLTNDISVPAHLKGLPISEARKILSRFCQIKKKKEGKPTATLLNGLAILCDGSDPSKTLLLGLQQDDGENENLTTFKVTCSNKKSSISFLDPLDLKAGDECVMSSSFDLLDHRDKCREFRLEACWKDNSGHFSISNLHMAQFCVHVSAPFGYKGSPLQGYLRQLQHVMTLCNGLRNGQLPSRLSTVPYDAVEKLQELFVRIKNGVQETMPTVCGRGKKINLGQVSSGDVTDQLWKIFVHCETYQELVMCLKKTFEVLKKNEFPIFVRNDNDTLLARLVRQSSQGLIYFPPLTGLMPLKIVANVGLETIKRNYTSILVKNGLTSAADVDHFLKECLKEDVDASFSQVEQDQYANEALLLEILKKLHHVVDILCTIDLHTDSLSLKDMTTHLLAHYRLNSFVESHKFVIPVDARQALNEVEKSIPSMIRREYKIKDKTRVECYLSDLPESLFFQLPVPVHSSDAGGDNVSINNCNDSKECYKVKTEESVMVLSRPS